MTSVDHAGSPFVIPPARCAGRCPYLLLYQKLRYRHAVLRVIWIENQPAHGRASPHVIEYLLHRDLCDFPCICRIPGIGCLLLPTLFLWLGILFKDWPLVMRV